MHAIQGISQNPRIAKRRRVQSLLFFLTKVPHSPSFTLPKVHPATEGMHSVTLPLQPGACHVERYAMIISNLRIAGHRRAAETNNHWAMVTELMRDTVTDFH